MREPVEQGVRVSAKKARQDRHFAREATRRKKLYAVNRAASDLECGDADTLPDPPPWIFSTIEPNPADLGVEPIVIPPWLAICADARVCEVLP